MSPAACNYGKTVSGSLLHRFDAVRADVDSSLDAVDRQAHALNVGFPDALGVAHGMADIVPKLWPLAANFTLGHVIPPLVLDVLTNVDRANLGGPGHKYRYVTTWRPVVQN